MSDWVATRVTIPGGIWGSVQSDTIHDGSPCRDLLLRPVAADDEADLFGWPASGGTIDRATGLLARCLVAESSVGPVDVGTLAVGDREALLLQLHRLSLGGRLDSVVDCPAPECGERMEMELEVADLLVPPYAGVAPSYDIRVGEGDGSIEVRFRVPTAADLAALATDPDPDPNAGASILLERCVLRVSRGGESLTVADLDGDARTAIASAIAERDPQAEIELELTCPSCGHEFAVVLDAGTFLLQELDARGAQLLEDVHALALHYHWSERDILAMPAPRRERYLDLLAASLRFAAAAGSDA